MSKYFNCPNCGADVPIKAKACPECGSDDETGWSEEAKYIYLLPDRGDREPPRPKQRLFMAAIALGLIICFLIIQGINPVFLIPLILGISLAFYYTNQGKRSP